MIWAYYALLSLNAKKNSIPCCIQVLGQQCGSQPGAEQEAPICKWSGGSQESNHFRGPAEMVMSSMVIKAMQCHSLCNQSPGSDPTCTSFQTQKNAVAAEWRLTSFVLLWSTLGVQRLKMSYVGSCHKLSVPWLLVFQRDRIVNAHPHHNNIRHPSRENVSHGDADSAMNDHFKRQVILLKYLDILYHLMISYGWTCLKNISIDIQNNHHRYTRFQLRVLLWLGDARTRHCKPGFKNWDMQWEHGTSMSMWQGFPIVPLLPHVENSIWDCVATNPKSAQNSANLISWFKMSQCVCVCVLNYVNLIYVVLSFVTDSNTYH